MVRKTIHISNIQSQWLDDQCYNTSSLVRKLLDSYRSSVLDKVSDDKITKYTEQGREFRVPSVVNSTKLNRSYCNDICSKHKSKMPRGGKNPYATHVTCKKCDGIWMERTSCNKNKTGRLTCPCCNILVRVTARRKHGGETAKLYEG